MFFNDDKLSPQEKKSFLPRKAFLEYGKERFLSSFDAMLGRRAPGGSRRTIPAFVFKLIVAVIAVFGLTFGASIYANAKNVPADSPLYPLKRLAETVQLAFAKTKAKPALQAKFAARRTVELDDLAKRKPQSKS